MNKEKIKKSKKYILAVRFFSGELNTAPEWNIQSLASH